MRIKFQPIINILDCLVSTDVLEHVLDPLDLFSKMIDRVNKGGYLLIANHFYPSIKCHLPATFHLRYSFDKFAEKMGLEIIGVCEGSHATIYKKTQSKELDWQMLRKLEKRSRFLFPFNEFKQIHIVPWQNRLIKVIKDPVRSYKIIKSKIQNKLS
jgi:2-polyprenyl-3-methyl-5-hydroxy-6-metoxy-1,4-benzoquinol methylase